MKKKLKVLNLYAGIGGNRKLWPSNEIEVTAIELEPYIAGFYLQQFPDDKIIHSVDAHDYLLKHFKEFDFIWSSPPCPTHSNTNRFLNAQGVIRYPDMSLYQEIIFLKEFFKGKWVVENVIPYYEPLVPGQISGRHMFWCNFQITDYKKDRSITITNSRASTRRTKKEHLETLQKYHGIDICDDIKLLSNCVNPKLGLHIFRCAYKTRQRTIGEFHSTETHNSDYA